MNEIRDILIGIDFGRKESQISYFDRKAGEPLSVSMKTGTSQYDFPTCISKRVDRDEWNFGREAEYFAREQGAFLIENLYEICENTAAVPMGEEEFLPCQLLENFIRQILRTLGTKDPVKNTKCLVITVEKLTENMVRNLQSACEKIGFQKGHYMLQDYSESFFYHTLSQRPEYWSRNVAWFAFEGEKVRFRRLSVGMGKKPVVVTITQPREVLLSGEDNLKDLEFYQFITHTLENDIYSSIFISGEGFSQDWAVKSVPLLCRQKRKVFYSTNLYANGACYTAREKAEEHQLKDYLYAGDALVKTSIGMEMMVMGSPAFHLLIPAGNNWYESVAECELILDGPGDLVFQLGNMETGEKKKVCMKLPGLEKRPPKATRLKLELGYQSPKICGVTVQDLGFGDMYPSSKKTWRETIEWEE